MIPYTIADTIIANTQKRTGYTLLDENQGCVNGCRMGISFYRNDAYHAPQQHDDQEGFYVLEGKGYALIDGHEIPLLPGTSFVVPAFTDHVMKRDSSCEYCKVLWFHAASK